jgi:hypothetical protein
MPEGFYGQIFETERAACLLVEDRVHVRLSHTGAGAEAMVRPGSQSEFFVSASIRLVEAALARNDQYLVHGACLVENKSGRATLICAPSGAGKTTTAMALAHDGFALATDDATVVAPAGEGPLVWGFPRALKVHRKTAELLPWLGGLPGEWNPNGEQGVPLSRMTGKLCLLTPPRRVNLGAVLLLGPRSRADHVLRKIPKAEMLLNVAQDNVSWRPGGMTVKAQARFKAIAEIISRVPAFVLSVGPDLDRLAGVVSEALSEREPGTEVLG